MSSVDAYIYIIIAILGLAYPTLLQVIARLDEKYESENISDLFKDEFEWKAFRTTLVSSLVSIFIWSLKLEPLIEINRLLDSIIENSATILVASNTILLVISFFFFVSKILNYYNPFSFIPYLVRKHEEKSDTKYFTALSDLLLLSIKRKQTNLSRTLSNFFYTAFRKIRDQATTDAVIYPELYYEIVYKAIEELAILKEKRNYVLEHRTSGGIWLLGELQGKEISEVTYTWLWRNVLLAVEYQQDDLIVKHWETCHQYYTYNIPYIHPNYDYTANSFQVSNQEIVDKRINERKRFIEFHYALGGLLMYKERYKCIKRLFNHTQSHPPRYELLPQSMYEVFSFYFKIKDPYERHYSWIGSQYPFPELSGINAEYVIKKWIMSYMAVLFLRQYTITPYLVTMRPLDLPSPPDTQGELKEWIDGLDFFKNLVNEHLQNRELLKTLGLEFITQDWCNDNNKIYPTTFIETLKSTLENAYNINALTLQITNEKAEQFASSTKTIIEQVIDNLKPINNEIIIQDDNCDKWYVNGGTMLQTKDAFSEHPEAHYIDFDSFLASMVSRNLMEGLSETFFYKKTKSFLLKADDIFKAIDKLGIDKGFIIVNFGISLDYFINNLKVSNLTSNAYKGIPIYNFNSSRLVDNSLFILKKADLPNISTRPIDPAIITKYSLNKISNNINLYTSVIDLNKTSEEIFNENKQDKSDDEIRKSALLGIFISTEFKWKKDIEVIQLEEHSEFYQKGIANKLEDIKPITKEKSNNKKDIDKSGNSE